MSPDGIERRCSRGSGGRPSRPCGGQGEENIKDGEIGDAVPRPARRGQRRGQGHQPAKAMRTIPARGRAPARKRVTPGLGLSPNSPDGRNMGTPMSTRKAKMSGSAPQETRGGEIADAACPRASVIPEDPRPSPGRVAIPRAAAVRPRAGMKPGNRAISCSAPTSCRHRPQGRPITKAAAMTDRHSLHRPPPPPPFWAVARQPCQSGAIDEEQKPDHGRAAPPRSSTWTAVKWAPATSVGLGGHRREGEECALNQHGHVLRDDGHADGEVISGVSRGACHVAVSHRSSPARPCTRRRGGPPNPATAAGIPTTGATARRRAAPPGTDHHVDSPWARFNQSHDAVNHGCSPEQPGVDAALDQAVVDLLEGCPLARGCGFRYCKRRLRRRFQ